MSTQEYNDKRRDEINTLATQYDCTVIDASETTLQIDLDTEEARRSYADAMSILMSKLPELFETDVLGLWPLEERWKSKSGEGEHVVVKLANPLPAKERIMLQAILGSDGKREALNLFRVSTGLEENMVLFKPNPKKLTGVVADDCMNALEAP